MVAVATESKVGKFKMSVKPSSEPGQSSKDRSEALTNWLLSQWKKQQIQQN